MSFTSIVKCWLMKCSVKIVTILAHGHEWQKDQTLGSDLAFHSLYLSAIVFLAYLDIHTWLLVSMCHLYCTFKFSFLYEMKTFKSTLIYIGLSFSSYIISPLQFVLKSLDVIQQGHIKQNWWKSGWAISGTTVLFSHLWNITICTNNYVDMV